MQRTVELVPARGSQAGNGLVLLLGLGLVIALGTYGIHLYLSQRAHREAERLLETNKEELLRVSTTIQQAMQHVDSLASHWEVTQIRRDATGLSKQFDDALDESSRLRQEWENRETAGAKAKQVESVVSRLRLLEGRIQSIGNKAALQLVTLKLSHQLTLGAVEQLGALQTDLDKLKEKMNFDGPGADVLRTRFDLLTTGATRARTLFKRGIEDLMGEDTVTGKSVAQAGINQAIDLRREIARFAAEIEQRNASQ